MNTKPVLNDLPDRVRAEAAALLNQQLVDALDLSLQAKQAHWNVTGWHFSSLHELFDQVATAFHEMCDLFAERAAQLGARAEGTSQVIVRHSRLPVYSFDLYSGSYHVRAVGVSLPRFAASTRELIRAADRLGDAATADILTQASRTAGTLLWKVSVHLSDGLDRDEGNLLATTIRPASRHADDV